MSNASIGQQSLASREVFGYSLRTIGVHAAMYGLAIAFLIPYIWMISTSLMTKEQAMSYGINLVPHTITFQWYAQLLSGSLIIQWTINTFLIATTTTLLVLIADSLIAFSLTRIQWTGRRYVLAIIMASFMVPGFVNIIPLYTIVSQLGLLNNYLSVILPFAAGPLGVFLLVQFFRDIPDELQEAARLDGFSTLRIYSHLILPLSKSIMTALGLFMFVWSWNQFLWPLIVLQNEVKYTLPIGLVTLTNTFQYQPALTMASAVIASAPLFVVFLLLQKQLISAVEMQAVT